MNTWFYSQGNQSVDLHRKSIHWFLCEWNSGLKRVKTFKRILKNKSEVIEICSTTEALKKDVKYVQSKQQKHQNDVNDVDLMFSLLTLNIFHTFF